MLLAGYRLRVLVAAQNVFVELHVSPAIISEEVGEALGRRQHLVMDVVDIDIDADCADDTELLPNDRNRRAFEATRADVEFVVELVLPKIYAAHEIDQELGRSHSHDAARDLTALDRGDGMRRVRKVVHENLDTHIREGATDQPRDVAVVL